MAERIECCRKLRDENYCFELWILGEGEEQLYLEEMIRKYRLNDQISLTGFILNPYPYIKDADILVCSSRYEGMSTVITEGLILGKAIVTTDCTGMQELLGDSEYGLITEESTEALYFGIKQMLDRPELIVVYSQKAKQRGDVFKKQGTIEGTEKFFEHSLLNKAGIGLQQ